MIVETKIIVNPTNRRKRILFITNTSAGQGGARQKMYPVISTLSENNCEVTVYPIIPNEKLTADSILREGFDEFGRFRFDVVLCCGGDGTLNHVINALMDLDIHVPIGYIPSGSTNDFSKNLNGDLTTEDIARAVAGTHTYDYDIGRLEGKYFNYVAGFGAFTGISYSTDQTFKNVFGYGAYILNMIATLPQNISYKQHVVVEHDGQREEDEYIFGGVTNSLSIAGVESPILSNASLNDGLFEVLLVKAPSDLIDMNEIVQGLSKGNADNPYVKVFHTRKVAFHADSLLDWTVDGEFGGSYRDATIEVFPRAIKIMVP